MMAEEGIIVEENDVKDQLFDWQLIPESGETSGSKIGTFIVQNIETGTLVGNEHEW